MKAQEMRHKDPPHLLQRSLKATPDMEKKGTRQDASAKMVLSTERMRQLKMLHSCVHRTNPDFSNHWQQIRHVKQCKSSNWYPKPTYLIPICELEDTNPLATPPMDWRRNAAALIRAQVATAPHSFRGKGKKLLPCVGGAVNLKP